jgi:hypothetical protein
MPPILGFVGVGPALVDLQFLEDRAAELVVRDHPPDGPLDDLFRLLGQHFLHGPFPQPAGIEGVVVVHLLFELVPGDPDLLGVDHDDKIPRIDVGREAGLVLSAKQDGDLGGHAAEHLAVGVDQPPLALDLFFFRIIRLHACQP